MSFVESLFRDLKPFALKSNNLLCMGEKFLFPRLKFTPCLHALLKLPWQTGAFGAVYRIETILI